MGAGLNMSVAHSITAPKLGDRCKNIFGSALIKGLVGDGGAKEGIEATVQIRQCLDALAGTRCGQSQPQANGGNDPFSSTKLRVFAAGVEQRFRKDPLELVRDHAKLSAIHRGLLSLSYKQHTQEEFRMDHHKNP